MNGWVVLIFVLIVIVFIFVAWVISRYKKCPSDKIMVIYGKVKSKNGIMAIVFINMPKRFIIPYRWRISSKMVENSTTIGFPPELRHSSWS